MTVREILNISGISFTESDISDIGMKVGYVAGVMNIKRSRTNETVGERTYSVWDYPANFKPIIENVIIEFFKERLVNG